MMDRSFLLVYLFSNAMYMICAARFFRHNAGNRVPFLKELTAYGIFYAVIAAVFLTFGIPMLNLVVNLVGLILLTRLYEKSWKRNILTEGQPAYSCQVLPEQEKP